MKSLAIFILWCGFYFAYAEYTNWWLKYKKGVLLGINFKFDFNDENLMYRYTTFKILIRILSIFTIISFLIIFIYNGASGLNEYFKYSEWYWDIIFCVGLFNMFLEIYSFINHYEEKKTIDYKKRFNMVFEIEDLKRQMTNLKRSINDENLLNKDN